MNGVFVERLKEARKTRELTQKNVAEKLAVTETAYASWEQGRAEPDTFNLFKLSQILNVSIDYLIGKENYDGTINIGQDRNGGTVNRNVNNGGSCVRTVAVNEEHLELLEKYKKAPKEIQRAIQKLLS